LLSNTVELICIDIKEYQYPKLPESFNHSIQVCPRHQITKTF